MNYLNIYPPTSEENIDCRLCLRYCIFNSDPLENILYFVRFCIKGYGIEVVFSTINYYRKHFHEEITRYIVETYPTETLRFARKNLDTDILKMWMEYHPIPQINISYSIRNNLWMDVFLYYHQDSDHSKDIMRVVASENKTSSIKTYLHYFHYIDTTHQKILFTHGNLNFLFDAENEFSLFFLECIPYFTVEELTPSVYEKIYEYLMNRRLPLDIIDHYRTQISDQTIKDYLDIKLSML
jgi:hypothetical protein